MPKKKRIKSKVKKDKTINNNGLSKIAKITTKSLSAAFTNFKKKQELKRLKRLNLKNFKKIMI